MTPISTTQTLLSMWTVLLIIWTLHGQFHNTTAPTVTKVQYAVQSNPYDLRGRVQQLEAELQKYKSRLVTQQPKVPGGGRGVEKDTEPNANREKIQFKVSGSLLPSMDAPKNVPDVGLHNPLPLLSHLYTKYAVDLRRLKTEIMSWALKIGLRQGICDIEAEVLYMRIRELKPKEVAEFGFGQGLATSYILSALRDNGFGRLTTFDIQDRYKRVSQQEASLTQDRWRFQLGDAQKTVPKSGVHHYDYVHSDCEHSKDFAKWLVNSFIPHNKGSGFQMSFHDVFLIPPAQRKTSKWVGREDISPEAAIILDWMQHNRDKQTDAYAFAPSHFEDIFTQVRDHRKQAGLDEKWVSPLCLGKKNGQCHTFGEDSGNNPTMFWTLA